MKTKNNLNKLFLLLSLISVIFFFLPSHSNAELIIQEVMICGRKVNNGDKITLRYKDLEEGQIKISGKVLDTKDIVAVEVSIDSANTWIKLDKVSPWEYEFIPKTGSEYTFLAHTISKDGTKSHNFIAIIQPDTQELISTFDGIFKEMRDVYIDERLREFLEFFDRESYPNFVAFKENMENTFDQSSNFNLKISIRNVSLDGDTALVRVDWIKTYEDVSRDTGYNNIIRFHKVNGVWKIFDIEDEKNFIVGTGTFRGNITDR